MSDEVFCKCGERASFSQVKKGINEGRWFFACANWKEEELNCKFFRWAAPSAYKRAKKDAALPKPVIAKPARSVSLSPPRREMTPIVADRELAPEVRRFVASTMWDYHRAMLQRSLDEAQQRVKDLTEELREFEQKMNEQETA
jgi:hypothetical protein